MKHVTAIAGRELRSPCSSRPSPYVVLTLWSVLAGSAFIIFLLSFQENLIRYQQFQLYEQLQQMNLNDSLIAEFYGFMWFTLVFLIPGITMGLFASEKANGTEELLLTSPITIWETVLGKFLAAAAFVGCMMAIVAFYPALLFVYGDPEIGKTAAGLLGLFLVSLTYVAVGAFASSLTRSQLIAFILGIVLLFVIGMILPVIGEFALGRDAGGSDGALAQTLRYMSTGVHFEQMLQGLVETKDVAYYGVAIGVFLVLTKTAVESARWR